MKVQFLTRSAGPNGIICPGDIVDVPEAEAKLLVGGKFAVALEAFKADVVAEVPKAPAKKSKKKEV